ncbi:MAG: CYTH domain-containing protein [Candidatus Wildermuthbacteria bacterium]|nr:CYTH domain-containing protein [Candidatus Wildermuthbacteria bacterium]
MIEIEKKFTLQAGDRERLLKDAEFVKRQEIHDTYYDTKDYSLAKKDWWLRFRNGNFELKVSFRIPSEKEKYAPTQYREFETDEEIKKALEITSEKSLKEALREAGYDEAFSLTTIREKYKKEGFTIDLDSVDYGYELAEIELMVEDENQINEAGERIRAFAEKQGLSSEATQGKVLEYMRRFQPIQYQALIDAWRDANLLRG